MIEQLGGRKFIFALLLVFCFGVFTFIGKMSFDQFMTGAILALGIFSGANAAQKFSR